MGFFSWILSKGLAGAIAKDIIVKYTGIKKKFPNEKEEDTIERVWNFWLTLNENQILTKDDEHKIVRLEVKKEKLEWLDSELQRPRSLLDIYMDVLYIETEISLQDGKTFDNAIQVFLKEAKKHGLDFDWEYEKIKRITGL